MVAIDSNSVEHFVSESQKSGEIWGLHSADGWVICDSALYEDTDVMPFWSSRDNASVHCVNEWAGFEHGVFMNIF